MVTDRVVELGRLVGEPTRAALLDGLLDGRAHTVTELRRQVGVAASTASEHLARLLDAGLVAVEAQGRHRYYRLADAEVAAALESLFVLGEHLRPVVPVPGPRVPADLAFARTCYDHLAGTVAVGLTDHLVGSGRVELADGAARLTAAGEALLAGIGVDPCPPGRRVALRRCLDWSERRPHLAGAVPAELLRHMVSERWFTARPSSRALWLNDTGRRALLDVFDYTAP